MGAGQPQEPALLHKTVRGKGRGAEPHKVQAELSAGAGGALTPPVPGPRAVHP